MSAIALIMNGLLGALLLGALFLGWRLDARLKALRVSQAGFAAAVADLDRAASRAEQGLAELRAATDGAGESLAGRIERAQTLSASLEGLTRRGLDIESRLERLHADHPGSTEADSASVSAAIPPALRAAALARFAGRHGAMPPRTAAAVVPAPTPGAELILEREGAMARPPPSGAARLERLRSLAQLQSSLRSRPAGDEELFAAPAPRRAAGAAG
ncbi:MAG TPA: DUF6468 domain-containing protein [Caulobacteraceae bacterium]|nr:DUF6468 domain-containing protein [Caulobacteraceae bacterium]